MDNLVNDLKRAKALIVTLENKQYEMEKNEKLLYQLELQKKEKTDMSKATAYAFVILPIITFFVIIAATGKFLLGIVGIIGILVIMFAIYIPFDTKRNKTVQLWYDSSKEAMDKKKDQIIQETKEILDSDEFKFADKLIPDDYFDSESVDYFIRVLTNNRADSFKEAINLYEEFLHQQRVEEMQKQQLQITQQALTEQQYISKQNEALLKNQMQNTDFMRQQLIQIEKIRKTSKATRNAARIGALITLLKK